LRGALITGTNGKGSTGAFLASILHSAGHHVGFMPKPHLVSYTERIQVDSQPISEAEFAAAVAALRPQLDGISKQMGEPTEFEILTGLALSYLAPRVDRLVCEVGMGGRLDATNVLDLGVAVVTNVALDHMQYLGDTIEKIATEKAAIIKSGNQVVTGCTAPALAVVESAAAEAGATLWRLDREIRWSSHWLGWEGSELDVEVAGKRYTGLRVPLLGAHQAFNAALAVAAAEAAGDATPTAVRDGLAATVWPGRLELAGSRPRILLDGGHNPDGLEQIGADVRRLVGDSRLVVVFGAMADKDLDQMLDRLRRLDPAEVVFTSAESAGARAADPEELARRWGAGAESVTPSGAALDRGRDLAGQEGAVLVCGSLYLVGEVRPALVRV
jgi:dihydrofolate synthase/folylpolyglutamate synthase